MELVNKIKSWFTTFGLLNTIIEGFLVMLLKRIGLLRLSIRVFWRENRRRNVHFNVHFHRRDGDCGQRYLRPSDQRYHWYEQWYQYASRWSPGYGYRVLRGRSGRSRPGSPVDLRQPNGEPWRWWVLNPTISP